MGFVSALTFAGQCRDLFLDDLAGKHFDQFSVVLETKVRLILNLRQYDLGYDLLRKPGLMVAIASLLRV